MQVMLHGRQASRKGLLTGGPIRRLGGLRFAAQWQDGRALAVQAESHLSQALPLIFSRATYGSVRASEQSDTSNEGPAPGRTDFEPMPMWSRIPVRITLKPHLDIYVLIMFYSVVFLNLGFKHTFKHYLRSIPASRTGISCGTQRSLEAIEIGADQVLPPTALDVGVLRHVSRV